LGRFLERARGVKHREGEFQKNGYPEAEKGRSICVHKRKGPKGTRGLQN